MARTYDEGFRKCACSMCGASVQIPKRFCEGCLINCHTIMSAAESLDDICTADFSNLDWNESVRDQEIMEGGGPSRVIYSTAEGIYSDDTDNGNGDAMGQGVTAEDAAQMAAEAFAEAFAAGDADDGADGAELGADEAGDAQDGQGMGAGNGSPPPFVYVITRRAFNLDDTLRSRGVVGTSSGFAVFQDLKSAQRFGRPMRRNHPRNAYRCKKIDL